jgi:hypothetical protein
MSIQEKGEGRFELVTSTSLGVVHSRLSYPLRIGEEDNLLIRHQSFPIWVQAYPFTHDFNFINNMARFTLFFLVSNLPQVEWKGRFELMIFIYEA